MPPPGNWRLQRVDATYTAPGQRVAIEPKVALTGYNAVGNIAADPIERR